jgi:hypothetical protein
VGQLIHVVSVAHSQNNFVLCLLQKKKTVCCVSARRLSIYNLGLRKKAQVPQENIDQPNIEHFNLKPKQLHKTLN